VNILVGFENCFVSWHSNDDFQIDIRTIQTPRAQPKHCAPYRLPGRQEIDAGVGYGLEKFSFVGIDTVRT